MAISWDSSVRVEFHYLGPEESEARLVMEDFGVPSDADLNVMGRALESYVAFRYGGIPHVLVDITRHAGYALVPVT